MLGGGGAKGAAAIGVLRELERAKIPIDYIAGTSIGAIIGGLYAQGYRADDLDKLFRSQNWLSLLADRDTALVGKMYKEEDGVVYVSASLSIRRRMLVDRKDLASYMATMSTTFLTALSVVRQCSVVLSERLFPLHV